MGYRNTSILAYLSVGGTLGAMQQVVLTAIVNHPGCTDRELCSKIGLTDANMLRPRRKELLDLELIEDGGVRTCEISGKKAHIWFSTLGKNEFA